MTTPRSIDDYLAQLRAALRGADPAVIQDALYDAEDHLRAELAEHPDVPQHELLARIAGSYGAPAEVAEIYLDKEHQVQQALRTPRPPPPRSTLGRFFAVAADPRAYAALFYMLLALPTGIFYFTWTVTGTSLSLGLMVLIIGLPFAALFVGTVRALSLVEGRLVEVMLGERMPRRTPYADASRPLVERAKAMFTDPRTWSTLLYFVLRLPLGIVYFTLAVALGATAVALLATPVVRLLAATGALAPAEVHLPPFLLDPLIFAAGVTLLFGTLHLARGIGKLQGALAKHLLVRLPG